MGFSITSVGIRLGLVRPASRISAAVERTTTHVRYTASFARQFRAELRGIRSSSSRAFVSADTSVSKEPTASEGHTVRDRLAAEQKPGADGLSVILRQRCRPL